MRIVIDLQGAQAASRFRGMGRYSLSLALGLVRNRGEHEVYIALNGLFPDSIDAIRAAFDDLLPQECIRVWSPLGPVYALDSHNDGRRHVAEILYEQFLGSMSPDVVLVASLFEGFGDNAVTSVHRFGSAIPIAVILYDLIPLIHSKVYFQNPTVERWYNNKYEYLRKADLLLSISASSGQEAIEHLNFNHQQVVNISAAAEDHFRPAEVADSELSHLAKEYGLVRPFVMYTGGADHRKNIERLITAYAQLPFDLRREHQLAVVCSVDQSYRDRLLQHAGKAGLSKEELILTGFVPEEDLLACYRSCKLFVFPSWHEGFGLPALEAMQCGKAVIAANTSSLPEVVGHEGALFDPFDTDAITKKMTQVLTDESFRSELELHGSLQARQFNWDNTAMKAWKSLEVCVGIKSEPEVAPANRLRLAYVSPLHPEAGGISDYGAELLPKLSKYYSIEIVVNQDQVSDSWIRTNCPIRSVEWFRKHAHEFDRILYHFGNSHFHSHMFSLLHDHPGVVVLHDFFLSGIVEHQDVSGENPHGLARALLESHGWKALESRFHTQDTADVVWGYPCNLRVLQDALGIIVHSDYSRQLARDWYGNKSADDWSLIPLIRNPVKSINRSAARRALGMAKDAFVVCSFGLLGKTKLNHRLLTAWLASPLAQDPRCHLIFVGQNHSDDYCSDLARRISQWEGSSSIKITGWADSDVFHQYLSAADVGVQLRTLSRGETSGTVLDCMNYGLATIVNANGSMAELNRDAVWMLSDNFNDSDLIEALSTLQTNKRCRHKLGKKARQVIAQQHNPVGCAEKYFNAIEDYNCQAAAGLTGALEAVAEHACHMDSSDRLELAAHIAKNSVPSPLRRQLLVDISELVQRDARSGIQRVVRSVLNDLLRNPPKGWQVEPVYATSDMEGYRYARRFGCDFLGVPHNWITDDLVDTFPGDVFLGLDFQPQVVPKQIEVLKEWHRRGVGVQFIVYDLLPLLRPDFFMEGAKEGYLPWLETVTQFDGAICISRSVAEELQAWLQSNNIKRERPFEIQWFHLGADSENSVPSSGMPTDACDVLSALNTRPSFLSVGTIEPRKGYAQILAAFESLWAQGVDANLVLVGKQGWKVEPLVEKLRTHAELATRLFWLEGISDEYLEEIYGASQCLIAASEAEGFGLPLIEAAQKKLPIIARDIPVFREVSGGYAHYFENSNDPQAIAKSVKKWLSLNDVGQAPQSKGMPWMTWSESVEQLVDLVIK